MTKIKKQFYYIIDTIRCRFSKQFYLKNAKVKWITYNVDASSTITVKDSVVSHCGFAAHGKKNRISFVNGANMAYTSVSIHGDGNEVIFDGCSGIVALTIRGNGCKVFIGEKTTMEHAYLICMGNGNAITIGEDCMFAGQVEIWNTDSHLITDMVDNPINPSRPVVIGNHVWIGKRVCVLKGVTIGDNSVIGMGSVVAKDIPSHSIAAGNPVKVIKEGTDWKKGFIKI